MRFCDLYRIKIPSTVEPSAWVGDILRVFQLALFGKQSDALAQHLDASAGFVLIVFVAVCDLGCHLADQSERLLLADLAWKQFPHSLAVLIADAACGLSFAVTFWLDGNAVERMFYSTWNWR